MSLPVLSRLLLLPSLALAAAASAAAPAELAISETQLTALGVRLEAPQPAAEAGSQRFPARVTVPAAAERAVIAPLAGTVERLQVGVGDTVAAGAPLATLFSAELGALQAEHVQLGASERLARADRDRDAALLADGLIAPRRLDETRARHEVAAARLAESSRRLKQAGAGGGGASLTLRAPMAGVVLARGPGVGERLEAGALVYRIAALDRLLLEVQVPVELAGRIRIGDRLGLRDGDGDGTATVAAIGHDASGLAQTVVVRAALDGAGSRLRPGQVVEVEQRLATADGWSLPDAAVVRDAAGSHVYRRTATGLQVVPVTVGGHGGGRTTVQGALAAQDRIAVSAVIAVKGAFAGHGGGE